MTEDEAHIHNLLALRDTVNSQDIEISQLKNKLEKVSKDRDDLKEWKRQMTIVNGLWDRVDEYVRNHPEAKLGQSVSSITLDFFKDRDYYKELAEKLEQKLYSSKQQ